jgi:hypothetical protein
MDSSSENSLDIKEILIDKNENDLSKFKLNFSHLAIFFIGLVTSAIVTLIIIKLI